MGRSRETGSQSSTRKLREVMGVLRAVMLSQVHPHLTTCQITYFKYAECIVCQWYRNTSVNKRGTGIWGLGRDAQVRGAVYWGQKKAGTKP